MNWMTAHHRSVELAAAAQAATRSGKPEVARSLYIEAATVEVDALGLLSPSKIRTLGVARVSAAALFLKGGDLERAELLACQWIGDAATDPAARVELRKIIDEVWIAAEDREREVSRDEHGLTFAVRGGTGVSRGGAMVDLIAAKVSGIRSLYFRAVEMLLNEPLRRRGGPTTKVLDLCPLWMFQARPASFRFTVSVQPTHQGQLFESGDPTPAEITDTVASVLRTAATDPDGRMDSVAKDDDYASAFAQLAIQISPDGASEQTLEVRRVGDSSPIVLTDGSRASLQLGLKRRAKARVAPDPVGEQTTVSGVLRGLQLDHDWIDVLTDGGVVRVSGVSEVLDDIIGPMVNRKVNVYVVRANGGAHRYVDIALA